MNASESIVHSEARRVLPPRAGESRNGTEQGKDLLLERLAG
jgi:hypothetical protein